MAPDHPSSDQQSFIIVNLSNGVKANVVTERGANTFLHHAGETFLRSKLTQHDRKRLASLRGNDKRDLEERLVEVHVLIASVAANATNWDGVPQSELQFLIGYIKTVLAEITQRSSWKKDGVMVTEHDDELFQAILPLARHPKFCTLMRDKGLLAAIARLCSALDGTQPSPAVADTIVGITFNYHVTRLVGKVMTEIVFSELESSGLLRQCFSMFLATSSLSQPITLQLLSHLQTCPAIIRKKFKAETPMGDALQRVLHHASNLHPDVRKRLENVQKLAIMSDCNWNQDCILCRNCSKKPQDGEKLLQCSRCKTAVYCSRECQITHWKTHKPVCTKTLNNIKKAGGHLFKKQNLSSDCTVVCFLNDNYFKVMEKLYEASCRYGVGKEELVIELNFYGLDAPGLRGEFKVGLTDRYINGARPDEPDWFSKGSESYEEKVKSWLLIVKDHFCRLTDVDVLFVVRKCCGSTVTYRMTKTHHVTKRNMMSTEAMIAVGTYDVVLMQQIMGPTAKLLRPPDFGLLNLMDSLN